MKIDAAQRSVLEEVRDVMYMDAESDNGFIFVSHYICSNILHVLLAREGRSDSVDEKFLSADSKSILDTLRSAILRGIGGRLTFGGYLRRAVDQFALYPDDVYVKFVVLGRLAWLDKILETGEIAEMEGIRLGGNDATERPAC